MTWEQLHYKIGKQPIKNTNKQITVRIGVLEYDGVLEFEDSGKKIVMVAHNPRNACYKCKHYKELRLQEKNGITLGNCCTLLENEKSGWVQQVNFYDTCEMFTEKEKRNDSKRSN